MDIKGWWKYLHHIYKIVVVVGGVCIFSILMILIINATGHGPDGKKTAKEEKKEETTSEAVTEVVTKQDALLASPTDSEVITQLDQLDSEIKWIKNNENIFPAGTYERAAKNPELTSFLYEYGIGRYQVDADTTLTDEDQDPFANVRLYQWDKRWGYKSYGDSNIGMKGSAATVLSMAIIDGSADVSVTPDKIAEFINSSNGYNKKTGTEVSMIEAVAKNYGFVTEDIKLSAATLKETVESGKNVILRLGEGNATDGGHFVIVMGMAEGGTFIIHDPYSKLNSQTYWSFEKIADSVTNSWVIYKAAEGSEGNSEEAGE